MSKPVQLYQKNACTDACMHAQSCPTICNTMDCSLPGSSAHRISRQEYWSGFLFPPPGDTLDPEIEPVSLVSSILVGGFFTSWATRKAPNQQNGGSHSQRLHTEIQLPNTGTSAYVHEEKVNTLPEGIESFKTACQYFRNTFNNYRMIYTYGCVCVCICVSK